MPDSAGRVALVTGGASGIGSAIARRLRDDGARVMIADIDSEGLERAVADLGEGVRGIRCDVRKIEDVEAAVRATVDAFGGLDILVNNAGVELHGSIVEQPAESFQDVVQTNLMSTFYGIKCAVLPMVERGGGAIINLSSPGATAGVPLFGAYCAAKAGVASLSRVAALELRAQGIRVNTVCPGFVRTPATIRISETLAELTGASMEDALAARQGGWGRPEDIAAVVAHLVADDAAFVTGTTYVADNGLTASLF